MTHPVLKPRVWAEAARLAPRVRLRELPRIVLRVDGIDLEVPRDRLWAFRSGTYYERNVAELLRRTLREQDAPVFYDLGAHIGYYALAAAALAEQVYAFEPASATHAVLERNIGRNEAANVRAFRLAVVDDARDLTLNLYETSGNNSVVDRRLAHLQRRGAEPVPGTSLDALVAEGLRPPTLIKMDVEGSELRALQGARATIERARPVIFVEWWSEGARDAGHSLGELAAELRSRGYTLRGLADDPEDLALHDLAAPGLGTVIATP